MKIFVKAKAGAKEDKITPPQPRLVLEKEELWIISVKEPPIKGRANEAIIGLLAKYFDISKSKIRLISGVTSKRKVFEITE